MFSTVKGQLPNVLHRSRRRPASAPDLLRLERSRHPDRWSGFQDRAHGCPDAICGASPRITLGDCDALLTKLGRQLLIVEQTLDAIGVSGWVMPVDQEARTPLADHRGEAGDVGGDHRAAAGLSLEPGEAK